MAFHPSAVCVVVNKERLVLVSSSALAIPWRFTNHELVQMWQWFTEHFEARISVEGNSFAWDIHDLVAEPGERRFLTEGRTALFAGAEAEVRETIGKSYPAHLGYRKYAGTLATTFSIATGERIDFGLYDGMRVVVTVRLPNGHTQSYIGSATVIHYELHLTPDAGGPVKIQPSHIVKIVGEGGNVASNHDYTGVGRTFRGEAVRGCTGAPGYMLGTVDHDGDPCPVHEEASTRFR